MNIPDPTNNISSHFTWRDALWLPSWSRMGNETDGLTQQILDTMCFLFQKMDVVRDYFGMPIHVHVTWRPIAYNKQIGGAINSAHIASDLNIAACDFDMIGINCDDARNKIISDNKLDDWQMRMEQNPGGNWLHLDTRQPLPGHPRFFKP